MKIQIIPKIAILYFILISQITFAQEIKFGLTTSVNFVSSPQTYYMFYSRILNIGGGFQYEIGPAMEVNLKNVPKLNLDVSVLMDRDFNVSVPVYLNCFTDRSNSFSLGLGLLQYYGVFKQGYHERGRIPYTFYGVKALNRWRFKRFSIDAYLAFQLGFKERPVFVSSPGGSGYLNSTYNMRSLNLSIKF